jgi:hypothetical protein
MEEALEIWVNEMTLPVGKIPVVKHPSSEMCRATGNFMYRFGRTVSTQHFKAQAPDCGRGPMEAEFVF